MRVWLGSRRELQGVEQICMHEVRLELIQMPKKLKKLQSQVEALSKGELTEDSKVDFWQLEGVG